MKKIGILALTLTLLFCLSGCNVFNVTNQILGSNQVDSDAADKDVESGKISLGEVENHTYRNDSFGISCTLTDEWVFLSHEEILSVNSLSAELMGDELAQQIADAPILYDMTANNPVTGASITVNMEKITILQAATLDLKATLESQFEGIRTGLSNIGYADVTITYEKVEVGGRQYDGATVHATIQGIDFYEVIFCYRQGQYIVNVTIGTLQTDTTADLLSTFAID